MAIDIQTRRSKLGRNLIASLGGQWMKPIFLRLVWEASKAIKIPIIGRGRISCSEVAIEFLIVRASALQRGIFNTINPRVIIIETIDGIKRYMFNKKIERINDLIRSFILS